MPERRADLLPGAGVEILAHVGGEREIAVEGLRAGEYQGPLIVEHRDAVAVRQLAEVRGVRLERCLIVQDAVVADRIGV